MIIYGHIKGQVADSSELDEYTKAEMSRKLNTLTYLQLKVEKQAAKIEELEAAMIQKQETIDNLSAELGRLKRKINKPKTKATGIF